MPLVSTSHSRSSRQTKNEKKAKLNTNRERKDEKSGNLSKIISLQDANVRAHLN